MKDKTYLITGGAGFLGSHLAQKLLAEDARVTIIDTAPLQDLDLIDKVIFYKGDVRDKNLLSSLIKEVDCIIHCAAALPLWSRKDIWSTNVEGTKNVLDAVYNFGKKRMIFISSTAVYGIPDRHPVYENGPLQGVDIYGKSKVEAEKICNSYREKGLIITTIRPKTFIGVGRMGVFQILFDWIKDGKKIPVIGDGKNKYQLLSVDDLVDFIIKVIKSSDAVANDTYNVGAGRFGTVEEDLVELFSFAKTGSAIRQTSANFIKFWLRLFELIRLSPLYKWIYWTADKDSFVNIEKAVRQVGWKPQKSNAETLIETYAWYLRHWEEYRGRHGIDHRSPWKQGILKIVKWFS